MRQSIGMIRYPIIVTTVGIDVLLIESIQL